MILSVDGGIQMFGPYNSITPLEDRLVCDGGHYPFSVIGGWEILDVPLPEWPRQLAWYICVDHKLVRKPEFADLLPAD